MAEDILSQDQIDNLMKDISMGEFETNSVDNLLSQYDAREVKYKYNAIVAAKARLEHSYMNGTFDETREATKIYIMPDLAIGYSKSFLLGRIITD